MEKSLFEQIGGTYRQEGDYCLPNLLPPENTPIGFWGQRRRQYLRNHHEGFYTALLLSGELDTHLTEIDEQATALFSQLVTQMLEREKITEQVKASKQMTWVYKMNNIRSVVEEVVNTEVIYTLN